MKITLLLVFLFSSVEAVFVKSALLQRNDSLIAVWGDCHKHMPCATDREQLEALAASVESQYKKSSKRLSVLIEEPINIIKAFHKLNFPDKPLVLHNLRDILVEHRLDDRVDIENIEMRGVALASEIILREQTLHAYLKTTSCQDARSSCRFESVTPGLLKQAFADLAQECEQYIAQKPPKQRIVWQAFYAKALPYFHKLQEALSACDQASALILSKETDFQHSASEIAHFIREAFARVFDIIVAHHIIELTNKGNDVALCAGFIHTENIMMLLMSDEQTRVRHRSEKDPSNTKVLSPDDMHVYRPRPSLMQRCMKSACSPFLQDLFD